MHGYLSHSLRRAGRWVKGEEGHVQAAVNLGPLCSVASLVLELGCRQMPGLKI